MSLSPGCRFGIFSDLSYELGSFGDCEHCVMPRRATVYECAPRTKSEEEECNEAPDGSKDDDSQVFVSLA